MVFSAIPAAFAAISTTGSTYFTADGSRKGTGHRIRRMVAPLRKELPPAPTRSRNRDNGFLEEDNAISYTATGAKLILRIWRHAVLDVIGKAR